MNERNSLTELLQYLKLGVMYEMAHSMAQKNYSVMKVFLNTISFPICSDIDSLWKRNGFQRFTCSSEMNSNASELQGHPISVAMRIK